MLKRFGHILGIFIGLCVFAAAVYVIWKQVENLKYDAVMAQFHALSGTSILIALACTAGAYLTLSIYDSTAFAYIKRQMAFPRIVLVSFISYSFSHNLGFGALTGNSIRYRFFNHWQVPLVDIARIVVFGGTAYILGLVTVAGILILANADSLAIATQLPISSAYLIGVCAAIVGSVYIAWSLARWPTIALKGVALPPPPLRIVCTQFGAAVFEWGFAAGALFFLLPSYDSLDYWHFIGIYVIAYVSGMISQVPGGVGVFEAVLLVLLPEEISREVIFATVITYRAVYFLLPLLIAAVLMLSAEVTIHGRVATRWAYWRRRRRRNNLSSS